MTKDCKSGACCGGDLSTMIDMLNAKLNQHGLTEIKFENDSVSLKLSKQVVGVSASGLTASAVSSPAPVVSAGHVEKSPMVGVAYLVPEPGADPFITVGKSVKKGDTLCLIEAMKTFNPVKASKDGVIKEILVSSEQVVEFDTPLVVIG